MLIQCDALQEKKCTKCKQILPISNFTKGPDNGYRYQCRACNLVYQTGKNRKQRAEISSRYYNKRKATNPSLFMWKQAKHRAQ